VTDQHDFAFISSLMRRHSSIVLEPGKEYLVESRLQPLAQRTGTGSVSGLVAQLQADPDGGLCEQVIDAMTICETSWFRDRIPFEALTEHVLPSLAATDRPRELRIWSAGCASGQEAYSLAMTAHEWLRGAPGWSVSVLATDRSDSLVSRARDGRYSQLDVNRGLPVTALMRYFDRQGAHWRVREEVRDLVEFRRLNLAGPFDGVPVMDVVFLRNVLIYFDLDTKRDVLRKVARILRPGGVLFLGAGETTLHLGAEFEQRAVGGALCYQPARGAAT
jgi:chemotaxis protein methyltransferase CheR